MILKVFYILIFFETISYTYECLTNENEYDQCGLPLADNSLKTVLKRSHPWIVSITCNYKISNDQIDKLGHVCGGTIISKKHILTAAHCLKIPNNYIKKNYYLNHLNPNLESVFKIAIENPKNEDEITYYQIKKVFIHESFDNNTLINDIGLIELENELEFNDYIQPICLPDQEIQGYPNIGSDSYLIAWHSRYKDNNDIKIIDMSVVNDDFCSKYGKQEIQLCAKALRKIGACRGDSGGPLIIQNRYCGFNRKCNVLAGITSYILGKRNNPYDCNSLYPTFFTRVSAFTSWIKKNMFNAYE